MINFKAQNREKAITTAMEKRGWLPNEAAAEVDRAVERLGISYVVYREQNFCLLSDAEQDRKALYLKEMKVEHLKEASGFVQSTMQKTGWTRVRAAAEMERLRKKLGLNYASYDRFDFALVPTEEQEAHYGRLQSEIDAFKKERMLRNLCVWKTAWMRGIERLEAVREVEDTVAALGITYQEYDSAHLNRYEPADKEWAYRSMLAQEKKQKGNLQRNIQELMEAKGWTRKAVLDMFGEYNREYGCLWGEFFNYKVYDMDEETIRSFFFHGYMQRLMRKYNRDPVVTRISINKEWTNRYLAKYIHRKWCVNRDITLEEFKTMFAGHAGVVYKPNYGFQARGVEVLYFNGDMEGVYNKIMSYSRGVVEEIIRQHPDMKTLSPESVNCLRIVSVSSKNRPVLADGRHKDIAYVSLKIGRNGSIVDNVIAGGMVANVDLETGTVATHGVNHALEVIENHPDTGTPIKGFRIPYFKEALELVYTVIDEMCISGTVGWDMAIGEDGPQIVEPNFGPAASLLQDPYWPTKQGMKERMTKYLWEEE